MAEHELHGVAGVDRGEDARHVDDVDDTEQRKDGKPDRHHRAEQRAHVAGAPFLHSEKPGQDEQRERNNVRLECGRGDLEALDRGQHGNRRRDRPVAIEQRGAGKPQQHQ